MPLERDIEIGALRAVGPVGHPPESKYERLVAKAKAVPAAKTVIAHPCDESSLRGAIDAAAAGIITPILVGPAGKIRAVADQHGIDIGKLELVEAPNSEAAAAKAVELIRESKGELLMKGSLHTDELMREVASSKTGLRTARRISHVLSWMCRPIRRRCSSPTLQSISSPISMPRSISFRTRSTCSRSAAWSTRVAILSAVETVTSKIPSTIEAAALCKMADRKQITGGILDGPLAFDNAIDPEAAKIKGIDSPVAGRAQILVVPDLEAGNMLAKNLTFLAKADAAGIVLGARVPVILTSRADLVRSRLASCAVAVLYADARRRTATVPAV
jgi:phosphate acetyltransferase